MRSPPAKTRRHEGAAQRPRRATPSSASSRASPSPATAGPTLTGIGPRGAVAATAVAELFAVLAGLAASRTPSAAHQLDPTATRRPEASHQSRTAPSDPHEATH